MKSFREIVVLSGRSGSGKSVASKALEDLGFYVVENLPPQLLDDLLCITHESKRKIALTIDVREIEFLQLMAKNWQDFAKQEWIKRLLFLDASDQKLIDRYHESKRRHPLDDGCGLRVALNAERSVLEPLRKLASKIIYTDKLNSHELRKLIHREVTFKNGNHLHVTLISFGFKYGVPSELDICFDVRFLSNPFYEPHLKEKNGLDEDVFNFVLSLPEAQVFMQKVLELMKFLYPLYQQEGRASLTLAVGCTGGRHRSAALVEALKQGLDNKIEGIRVEHRDLHRHT